MLPVRFNEPISMETFFPIIRVILCMDHSGSHKLGVSINIQVSHHGGKRTEVNLLLGWRYPATYPPQTLFPALQWLVRMTESRMLRRDAVSLADNERIVLYAVGMGVG